MQKEKITICLRLLFVIADMMNILHLKYAVEVAKTGSINRAAENLYMNQPNLSRAIKELEDSLGIVIFDRTARGMTLTHDGEKFLGYAKSILLQIDKVEQMYKKGSVPQQRFSISVPRASYISDAFTHFTKNIDAKSPSELFYKETNSMRAIDNILKSDYKLGIIRYAAVYDKYFKDLLDSKNLVYETVSEFNYVLVMSTHHKLADKDKICYNDLKPFIEIAHADPYVPSLPLPVVKKEELPDNTDRKIYVFERASQLSLLSENTETFTWASSPESDVMKRYSLTCKNCDDNDRLYKDVLIYRKGYKLSELDKLFITELCNSKRKYIK